MEVLYVILFVLTAACFLAASVRVGSARVNLLALGLFFWVLVPLIETARSIN